MACLVLMLSLTLLLKITKPINAKQKTTSIKFVEVSVFMFSVLLFNAIVMRLLHECKQHRCHYMLSY